MLTFFDHDRHRSSRRSFLRIGGAAAIGAGGLTLADLAALRAGADEVPGLLTGKSVIFLFLPGGPRRFDATGPLSSADAPFDASRVNARSDDLRLAIPRERLDDRRLLLGRLDDLARRLDRARALEGVDRMRDQAYRLLTGGLAEAFDL